MSTESKLPFDIPNDILQKTVKLCSKDKTVVIREMTGEDEDILTLVADQKDGLSVAKFISNVTMQAHSIDEIQSWRIRDKYLIMLEVVRLSYGDEFAFTYQWPDGYKADYETNLGEYALDSNSDNSEKAFLYPEEVNSTKLIVTQEKVEFKLDDYPEKMGFKFLTGELEALSLLVPEGNVSLNDELRNREFYIISNGNPIRVNNFRIFKSKTMAKIRSKIEEFDKGWNALITITHPKTRETKKVSLFSLTDFFFPKL